MFTVNREMLFSLTYVFMSISRSFTLFKLFKLVEGVFFLLFVFIFDIVTYISEVGETVETWCWCFECVTI